MKNRCEWVGDHPLYIKYHDEEWGRPVHDDTKLFEMLTLEGAQAGLSWLTVLKKRETYREAFDNWDIAKIAKYAAKKSAEILNNPGVIRNRLKVKSTIINAQSFLKIQAEQGSFSDYIWSFVDHQPIKNSPKSIEDLPATTELSDKISKDLKKRGFSFVGSTIIYAFMQAVGLVDDHLVTCYCKN